MIDPIKDSSRGIVQKVKTHSALGGYKAPELLHIGKPCVYHYTIDPDHRISNFFRGRMNIIDLLPCYYKINFSKLTESDNDSSGLVPHVVYDKAMNEFSGACSAHKVESGKGIRIYTLEDTQASDTITTELKENYFQSAVNKLTNVGSPIREFMKSVDSTSVDGLTDEAIKSFKGDPSGTSPVQQKVYSAAKDVIIKGHRISLPSIWKDSSYSPNITANLRLASPYGHPDAIKTFVIDPLVQLLIMASPQTTDGVSYGQPFFLTITAHGLSYSPIGVISNITLRRGGNDTSFNIYRQPLSIDVSLEFQYSVGGFAHASSGVNGNAETTALPTVGHIMKSLEPARGVGTGYSSISEARNTKDSGQTTSKTNTKSNSSLAGSDGLDFSQFSKNNVDDTQNMASLLSTNQIAEKINDQSIFRKIGDGFT